MNKEYFDKLAREQRERQARMKGNEKRIRDNLEAAKKNLEAKDDAELLDAALVFLLTCSDSCS